MKEFLSCAVAYIIDTRMKMNRPPFMATAGNIKNVVSQSLERSLSQLVNEGMLTEHVTLNEKAYEFTPPKR